MYIKAPKRHYIFPVFLSARALGWRTALLSRDSIRYSCLASLLAGHVLALLSPFRILLGHDQLKVLSGFTDP